MTDHEATQSSSAESLNKRGNPCGLCGTNHGAGPCSQATESSREPQMIVSQHFNVRQLWWRWWTHLTIWFCGFRLRLGPVCVEVEIARPRPQWRQWSKFDAGLASITPREKA